MVQDGTVLVDTVDGVRVLETSHPPTYYVPLEAFAAGLVKSAGDHTTVCEWKGAAAYLDLVVGSTTLARAGWTYPAPRPGYEALLGHAAFYADAVAECWVDDERVVPQEGSFYGGWITSDIIGPFKGGPGTGGWCTR
jgi:uncharacterized protein (DUF427 family)